MEETSRRAADRGVVIGAHPSYPDRQGFGRRDLDMPLQEIADSFRAQVELMMESAARAGSIVSYVKPHGALYNRAMRDAELANALVEVIPPLVILALPASALSRAAQQRGMMVAREAFMDRAYSNDGTLVPRAVAGAVIHDVDTAAARALRIATERTVTTIDGIETDIEADSLCVHSDSRNAASIVTAARAALENAGFTIRSFA
jgi:UPF0271 protein